MCLGRVVLCFLVLRLSLHVSLPESMNFKHWTISVGKSKVRGPFFFGPSALPASENLNVGLLGPSHPVAPVFPEWPPSSLSQCVQSPQPVSPKSSSAVRGAWREWRQELQPHRGGPRRRAGGPGGLRSGRLPAVRFGLRPGEEVSLVPFFVWMSSPRNFCSSYLLKTFWVT